MKPPTKKKVDKTPPSKKKVDIAIIITILAALLPFLGYVINNYYNRPQLDFRINSFSIGESLDKMPDLKIVLSQVNAGNSDAIYNIKECQVFFPLVSSEPIIIKVNKVLTLKSKESKRDTTIAKFPSQVEGIDFLVFDSLQYIELVIQELKTKRIYNIRRDYNELIAEYKPDKKAEEYPILYAQDINGRPLGQLDPSFNAFLKLNPKTGKQELDCGKYEIIYKGKTYINLFCPSTAKVIHKIKNEKIKIGYSIGYNTNGSSIRFAFIPDPAIASLIEYPDHQTSMTTYIDTIDNKIVYRTVSLDHKANIYGNIYYFYFE